MKGAHFEHRLSSLLVFPNVLSNLSGNKFAFLCESGLIDGPLGGFSESV